MLSLLLTTPGRIVSRDEFQKNVWDGHTFVDFEHGLNSCIKQIRAALGDDANAPRYIETIPKRGYRFVAVVEPIPDYDPCTIAAVTRANAPPGTFARLWSNSATLYALVILLVILGITLDVSRGTRRAEKVRLLVLPFANLSQDPGQEFYSDGLAEEMITELGKLAPAKLGVIAHTSSAQYKQRRKSIAEIRKELNVDYVLEGGVRRDAQRVHVTAQLIKAKDQTQVWAASYDRPVDQAFQLEREIASAIGQSLALNPSLRADEWAAHVVTRSLDAHDAYLRGRFQMNLMTLEGIRKARAYFEQALQSDSQFALAYAAIAETYTLEPWSGGLSPREAFPRAQDVANHALRLNDGLAEAHTVMGVIRFYYDWDLAGAENEFQRAIQLQSGLASAHYWYAGMLSAAARHREAIASIQRAQELDPLSPIINADAGWYYFYARRYDDAIRECRRALDQDPHFGFAMNCIMASHRQQRNYRAALDDARQLLRIRAENTGKPAESLPSTDPESALRSAAEIWRARADKLSGQLYVPRYYAAVLDVWLNHTDQAIADLKRAHEQGDLFLVLIDVDPRLDALRSDPRFNTFRNEITLH